MVSQISAESKHWKFHGNWLAQKLVGKKKGPQAVQKKVQQEAEAKGVGVGVLCLASTSDE